MEIATRPAIGTRVRVTFPATTNWPTETAIGRVDGHWPDAIDIVVTEPSVIHDAGEMFSLFDSERARGTTLEIL